MVCGSFHVSYSSCQRKFHRNQLRKIVFSCLYSFYFAYQVVTWCPLSRYRLQRCFLFNTINSAESQLGCLCHWISLAQPVVRIQGRLSLLPLRLRTTIKHGEKTKGCVKIILKTLNYPFRVVIRVLNVCGLDMLNNFSGKEFRLERAITSCTPMFDLVTNKYIARSRSSSHFSLLINTLTFGHSRSFD